MFISSRAVRLGVAGVAVVLLITLASAVTLAQTSLLGGKLRTGDAVTVSAGETINGDLYVFAGSAVIDGRVNGDLIVGAGDVSVGGAIGGDLLAAGGTVSVNGVVAGDARLAAGQLSITGQIGEDVAASAGQLSIPGGGQLVGDLLFWSGATVLAGSVGGDVVGATGEYRSTGLIRGTEEVAIGEEQAPRPATAADRVADAFRHFAVVVLVGGLALWLTPMRTRAAEATLRTNPLLALANGVLTIAGYAVVVILALVAMVLIAIGLGALGFGGLVAIDIVGFLFAIGLLSLAFVVAISFVADAIVGLALGRLALPEFATDPWRERALLAGGALLVVVLTSLPAVGGWLKLAVVLFGLGAISYAAWRAWRQRAAPAAPPPPATA